MTTTVRTASTVLTIFKLRMLKLFLAFPFTLAPSFGLFLIVIVIIVVIVKLVVPRVSRLKMGVSEGEGSTNGPNVNGVMLLACGQRDEGSMS